ncbi:hypothetical protein ACWEOZ_35460 [Actinoplanes sp. NPDC004185]
MTSSASSTRLGTPSSSSAITYSGASTGLRLLACAALGTPGLATAAHPDPRPARVRHLHGKAGSPAAARKTLNPDPDVYPDDATSAPPDATAATL